MRMIPVFNSGFSLFIFKVNWFTKFDKKCICTFFNFTLRFGEVDLIFDVRFRISDLHTSYALWMILNFTLP